MRDTIYKKDIKKSNKQRNEQLELNKEIFKRKLNNRKPQPLRTSPTTSENFQREKELRKRAQKELHNLQKKTEQHKQIIAKQKEELRENKKKVSELKHDRWELTQSLKQASALEQQVKQQQQSIQLERIGRLKAEETIHQMEVERENNSKGENKIAPHTNRVKQLKQSNASLKRQLENYDIVTNQKYGALEQEVKRLRKEVLVYRNREMELYKNPIYVLPYLKSHMTSDIVPDLLELVEGSITTKNLPYFYRGPHNVFYLLMRRVNLLAYQSRKRCKPYQFQNTHHTSETNRLGYLICDNDSWKFVDLSENDRYMVYPVIKNLSGRELTVDKPAKAIYHQEGVNILHLFSLNPPKATQPKQKFTGTNKQIKHYHFFGKFNILVIGSRFMNDYKHRLKMHGCVVGLHNPYEESYEVLKGKINRAEIILACERHIPHGIWDYVDKSQPYVSVLKQDSKDLISTHAYLTLQRCELV